MKLFLITFYFICSASNVLAKVPVQGVAIYKQTVNIHASLPKSQAAMKAFIPEFSYSQIKVSFTDNLIRFETKPLVDDKKKGGVIMSSGKSENTIYDSKNNQMSQYGNVMDIDYYYNEDLSKNANFNFSDESKEINGYHCKKAIKKDKTLTIWYQAGGPTILPSHEFSGISGLVVKIEGKQISYDLLSIEEKEIADNFFDIPQNHKKITPEQFQDLQEEAIEEMMSKMGNGAKMIKTEVN